MFLSSLRIQNFRLFGSQADSRHLEISLRPKLNVLVGENDAGKSTIVDAIRLLFGTTSHDFVPLSQRDFYTSDGIPAPYLSISGTFTSLTANEASMFLGYTDNTAGQPRLHLTLSADLPTGRRQRAKRRLRSGVNGNGPSLEDEQREYLAVTYLRPLRDAEAALMSGRGSRLAQILSAHPDFIQHRDSDFDADAKSEPNTITGIIRQAEHRIHTHPTIRKVESDLNERYLRNLSLGATPLRAQISVGDTSDLRQTLEKLELFLVDGNRPSAQRGLGTQNTLFIAAELLLLRDDPEQRPFLAIEEPEAHLHPQLQTRLMEFLAESERDTNTRPHLGATEEPPRPDPQVILTTHSPILASQAPVASITLITGGKAFSLAPEHTGLRSEDYKYLERFLDATKADMFFARSLILAEGPSERILIPTIARKIGRPLSKYGASIVTVDTKNPVRYARIFSRANPPQIQIRVGCLRDRDIVPRAMEHLKPKKSGRKKPFYDDEHSVAEIAEKLARLKDFETDNIRVFVSPAWTLEFDLALSLPLEVFLAANIAEDEGDLGRALAPDEFSQALVRYTTEFSTERAKGAGVSADGLAAIACRPLFENENSKPTFASTLSRIILETPSAMRFPDYIVDCINFVTGVDTRWGV